ncbi:transthyretin-like family protein [Pseudothermotoga thermarum]|uniref:Carboxypeptidase regulatory-like domain-containing protein n=1 Tax=Pseudothermotoga thermarum DSM 5069 TaxID=688269 RepID=F7YWG0_9THEM|nr:carboxypeptidase regulatory-like domain-containing protein [Pseudothermotoga thermarum]AEH51939.1 hypothetical protein Theth_1898 [Pseudothermotoga thermarum DSM 5069]
MKVYLLIMALALTFLIVGCSNVQVGFGVSVGVHLVSTTNEYIEFQIVDSNGRPISNVTVQVQIDETILWVKTDENGYVRIYGSFIPGKPYSVIVRYALLEITTTITLK